MPSSLRRRRRILTHLQLGSVCFSPVLSHWVQTKKPVAMEALLCLSPSCCQQCKVSPRAAQHLGVLTAPEFCLPSAWHARGGRARPWTLLDSDPKPWYSVLAFFCTSPFPKLSLGEPLFSCWLLIYKPTIITVSKWKKLLDNAMK